MSDRADDRSTDHRDEPSTERSRRTSSRDRHRSGRDRSEPSTDGPGVSGGKDGKPHTHDSNAGRARNRFRSTTEPSRPNGPGRDPPRGTGGGSPGSKWETIGRYALDITSSVLIVAAVGAFLFAASGIWPPLVAIESGSMEPHIQQGDLVFVMEAERFPGVGAHESGVVTAQAGQRSGYRTFEGYGDVIVYQPDGNSQRTPIIHRAMFWVEDGENWYERANPASIGDADSCEELSGCPAPHAGFITQGDADSNDRYDQVMGISGPVKPEWVMGTAEVRVPMLGEVRLLTGESNSPARIDRQAVLATESD